MVGALHVTSWMSLLPRKRVCSPRTAAIATVAPAEFEAAGHEPNHDTGRPMAI